VTVEDVNANDLVALFVEVVAFIALAVFAWRAAPTGVRSWVWMLGILIVAGSLWALFVSPQATFDVPVLALLLKIVILGAGVLALRSLTSPVWGILFGVVVVVNTVLIYITTTPSTPCSTAWRRWTFSPRRSPGRACPRSA